MAQGKLVYSEVDRAFQTHPMPSHAGSIQINEVELLLGQDGRVIGLSGYCPRDGWNNGILSYPLSDQGSVFCPDGLDADGIPIRFNNIERWRVVYDSAEAVVCMFAHTSTAAAVVVEVLKGLTLGLENGDLTQVWIRFLPTELPV